MASIERPKAKRRRTLNRSRDIAEEGSDEDYGEEILPTIDQDALATLPPGDQEKFKKMRKKDRKNFIARWRREGKSVPETSASSSSGSSRPPARALLAPQLPELQLDVAPRETFSSAFHNTRQPGPGTQLDNNMQSLGAGRSELREDPDLQQEHHSLTATHHNQDLAHLPIATHQDEESAQTSFIAHPSRDSEDTEDTSLWLRVMDTSQHTRGRRGIRAPTHDLTNEAGEPSSSNMRETPEQRRLKQLRHANTALQDITDHRELEYARFRGYGPVPPGLALAGNALSTSERVHARTVTNVNNVLGSTGQVSAHNAVTVARRAATPGRSVAPGEREFLAVRENLFVRPRRSIGQNIAPVNAWRGEARAHGMQLSPPSTVNTEDHSMPNLTAMTGRDGTEGLQEGMGNVKINPMKRMAKKVGEGIKGLFKGKVERAKPRAPERPPSQLRRHDEARVGTATAVSMTPVRAPQATDNLSRAPPPLQPAPGAVAARTTDPRLRTTRAQMENYD